MVISIFDGVVQAGDIIFFILFAAAYVYVLSETGALNALTGAMLRKLGSKDHMIIPIFMILFAIGGTTIGMYEETYGLIPAFMIIAVTLGYDRIVGGAIVFVGVATGFAAAILNPFTIRRHRFRYRDVRLVSVGTGGTVLRLYGRHDDREPDDHFGNGRNVCGRM